MCVVRMQTGEQEAEAGGRPGHLMHPPSTSRITSGIETTPPLHNNKQIHLRQSLERKR